MVGSAQKRRSRIKERARFVVPGWKGRDLGVDFDSHRLYRLLSEGTDSRSSYRDDRLAPTWPGVWAAIDASMTTRRRA